MKLQSALALLLVTSACGSDEKPPKEKPAEPAKPVEEELNPAINPGPERELQVFQEAVFRGCECEDRACADQARKDYAVASSAVAPFVQDLSPKRQKQHAKAKVRWLECTLQEGKRREEIRLIGEAACACEKGDKGCRDDAADGVSDMNNNPQVQAWLDDDVLRDISVKATKCLLDAGMSADQALEAGIPEKFVEAAK